MKSLGPIFTLFENFEIESEENIIFSISFFRTLWKLRVIKELHVKISRPKRADRG